MDYNVMRRTQQTYSEKYKQYQDAIDLYNQQLDKYKEKVANYNNAVKVWNAGPRTSPFTGVQPTAPSQRNVNAAEAIATQANPRFTTEQAQQLGAGAPPNLASSDQGLIRTILDKTSAPTSIEQVLSQARKPV